VGADVRGENIAIQGWKEQTNVSIFDFLRDMGKQSVSIRYLSRILNAMVK
jgi:phosphoribosylformimino-5-aminoimidazole carboxamide ribonucleotide (ProFAR) isomerase